MTKTAQDLAEEVLLELGVADGANPAESEDDIALVKRRYTSIWKEMDDLEVSFWDEDSIPDRVFDPLTQYIAYRVRKAFGVLNYTPDDAWTRLVTMGQDEPEPMRVDRALAVLPSQRRIT